MSEADFTSMVHTEKRLREFVNELAYLAPQRAKALQVIEFASENRKNLLARYMAPLLAEGKSVAAAEVIARADATYQANIVEQESQVRDAHAVDGEWRALMCKYDAARSLLSYGKEHLRTMEG